ncbi:hypothetical protein D3C80_1479490 [compost metagenome]
MQVKYFRQVIANDHMPIGVTFADFRQQLGMGAPPGFFDGALHMFYGVFTGLFQHVVVADRFVPGFHGALHGALQHRLLISPYHLMT